MNYVTTQGVLTPDGLTQGTSTVSGDAEAKIDMTMPASQTNILYNIAFTYANIKSFALYCAAACTVKTNSSGAPDNTIAIPAGYNICWDTSSIFANPFTADVTKIYVTNTAEAAFEFKVLYDPTP